MKTSYTPKADPRGHTLYAGSEYDVSPEVGKEVTDYGYGEYVAPVVASSAPPSDPEETPDGGGETERVDATEAAVKEAAELGVDLEHVKGSGSGGRITVEDVRKEADKENPV